MICGTMVFEDQSLQWRYLDSTREVEVVVQEGLTGQTAKVVMPARAFAASVALAIDPDGMEDEVGRVNMVERLYEYAEAHQPEAKELRWIP